MGINSDFEQFVGRGHYYGKVDVARLEEGRRYYFRAEHVCDTFRVKVNGVEADFPDQVKKETDITRLLQEGENVLEVTVTSNLYNKVVGAAKDEADFVFQTVMPFTQKSYGMWGEMWNRDSVRGIKRGVLPRRMAMRAARARIVTENLNSRLDKCY